MIFLKVEHMLAKGHKENKEYVYIDPRELLEP